MKYLNQSIISLFSCQFTDLTHYRGAHHWARELIKLGHQVVLLNARYVKNFVVGNKNDFNDAQAIFDAVRAVGCGEGRTA